MKTMKLTVAQAVIAYLKQQYVLRDGVEHRFFAGCLGIFGHGNIAGIGQALQQNDDFTYIMTRNEQSSVHIAMAYAKEKNRLGTWLCTSSIGPGATNMVTGAACATINRLPVLIIPGDIYARRNVAPVLQQLESSQTQDISVNDCFKPVSKYWDRINRAEQLITALPEVMRVLTCPAETGAVTLCIPQDVQAEAFDFPVEMFAKKVWPIARLRADRASLQEAARLIRKSGKPVIIAGGGVLYSEATEVLKAFVSKTGIPVTETFAGKGALPYNDSLNLGAVGATGTPGANKATNEADLVIAIGTRYSDFTTASKTAFQNPDVRFININVATLDAYKHGGLAVTGDARECLSELMGLLDGYQVDSAYKYEMEQISAAWDAYVSAVYRDTGEKPVRQVAVIGAVNEIAAPEDVVLCAAGSLPGDLHKLWRTGNHRGFHLEYGYSTMGYEVAAGIGARIASPDREVWVMVGDGNYLMMNNDIATAVQEGIKYTIILLNNNGFGSIGNLSESVGSDRFGTRYAYRGKQSGQLDGQHLPVDFAMNARSLGACVLEAHDISSLKKALVASKSKSVVTVIVIETDLYDSLPGHAWWEVPVAEVSTAESVQNAYKHYREMKSRQRYFF